MAKIPRVPVKVFGSAGPVSQFAQYGSLSEGTPQKSKDLKLIQELDTYLQGMFPATFGADKPPAIEDENALRFLFSSLIAYLYQEGIPEWDKDTVYYEHSFVKYQGIIYRALKENSNQPIFIENNLNNIYWKRDQLLFDDIVNDLASPVENKPLSAAQGKVLLDLVTLLENNKAPINNPVFTGNPTVPTITGLSPSALVTAKNILNYEMLTNLLFPVGRSYVQYPGDSSPSQMGWPGNWIDYTDKPVIYGVSTSDPTSFATYSETGTYTANQYVVYTHYGTDSIIVRAKMAMSNPGTFNPINWLFPGDGGFGVTVDRVIRTEIQSWAATPDLNIMARITSGTHNGKYIWDRIVMAGKFPSFAGGNRPTFVGGGVAGDQIREIWGNISFISDAGMIWPSGVVEGAFGKGAAKSKAIYTINNSANDLEMKSSLIVPTGPENSPRTLAVRYWRRVA